MPSNSFLRRTLACVLGGLFAATSAVRAADADEEGFSIAVGGFVNTLDLSGRVDGATVEGTSIDFDEDFALRRHRRLDVVELKARPSPHHTFTVRHFADARRRTASFDRPIRFDDREFLAQGTVEAHARVTSLEFDYTWWLHQDEQRAFGLQLGVVRLGASLALRGRIAVEDEGSAQGQARVEDRVYVPLAGLALRQRLGRAWWLQAEARYLKRGYRGIDGEALSGQLGLEWQFSRHLSLIARYAHTRVYVTQDQIDLSGNLEVGFRGPQTLLRARF